MKSMNPYFQTQSAENIFTAQTAVAQKHGSINLGQGFPENDGPDWLKKVAADHLMQNGTNQYCPPAGLQELRQAIAETDESFYDLNTNPEKNILVTAGATEALNISLRTLLQPGDEIILFSPYYNFYDGLISTTGAKARNVQLSPPDWQFDPEDLEAAIGPNTKALLLNTPSNPTGKIFTRDELALIADLVSKHDLTVISDEVYEFLTTPDDPHIPISTLPGMKDRTIRISSAGKTFSLTGWRLGYLSAPDHIMPALLQAHTLTSFCLSSAFQKAVTAGLNDTDFLQSLGPEFANKAKILTKGLDEAGFSPLPFSGGYFVIADFSGFDFDGNDRDFCYHLTKQAGVTPLPLSAFYAKDDQDAPSHLLRFCIAKENDTLHKAAEKLIDFAP